jgi:hypothetical protein
MRWCPMRPESRLSNRVHSSYVEVDPSAERKPTEPEIELKLVSLAQLAQRFSLENSSWLLPGCRIACVSWLPGQRSYRLVTSGGVDLDPAYPCRSDI